MPEHEKQPRTQISIEVPRELRDRFAHVAKWHGNSVAETLRALMVRHVDEFAKDVPALNQPATPAAPPCAA
jgi:predicted DNA-binding protein